MAKQAVVGILAAEQPAETLEPGEIHSRRKSGSHRDQDNPEQPEADAHLIPGVAPRSERQWQGRPDLPRSLLGIETGVSGPPCTISVPNLKTDRPTSLLDWGAMLNVRRLMYQSLIWAGRSRDHARGLRPPFDPKNMKGAAHTLVDGV